MYDKGNLTATPFKLTTPNITLESQDNKYGFFGISVASNNKYVVIGCDNFNVNGNLRQGLAIIYNISDVKSASEIPNHIVQVKLSGLSFTITIKGKLHDLLLMVSASIFHKNAPKIPDFPIFSIFNIFRAVYMVTQGNGTT